MLQRFKITTEQLINNPNAKIVFILGTMLLAALIGGAPNDYGGS